MKTIKTTKKLKLKKWVENLLSIIIGFILAALMIWLLVMDYEVRTEIIKNIFALIGVISILYHTLKN